MTTFHDLSRRLDDLVAPAPDLDALVTLGERRLRRRRVTAAVAGAAAIAALAVGGALANDHRTQGTGPIDVPSPRPTQEQLPLPGTRQVVYSDLESTGGAGVSGTSVHLGDREVETGDGFVHLDVTDDGIVYLLHGGVWFSDGGTPVQIGSHPCDAEPNGDFSNMAHGSVRSANAGSLVAWFDCTTPTRPALMVFDTAARQVVAHRSMQCRGYECAIFDVIGDRVYLDLDGYAGHPSPQQLFEPATGRFGPTTRQDYAADVASLPRGLSIGSSLETGSFTSGIGQRFQLVGSQLVAVDDEGRRSTAFDTGTRRALAFELPPDYGDDLYELFTLFEWLDDDTVALVYAGGWQTGDIVTCRVSDGRCALAARWPGRLDGGDAVRIVPNFPLPG